MTTLAFARQTKIYYYYQLFKETGKDLYLIDLPQRPHSKACYNEASVLHFTVHNYPPCADAYRCTHCFHPYCQAATGHILLCSDAF